MRETIKKLMPEFMITLYKKARYLGISALFYVARLLPLNPRLVVLCSVWGYGDNTRYVAEELLKREPGVCRPVFVTNHPKQVPEGTSMKVYRSNSVRAVLALARAGVWVDCNRKEPYIHKRKGQYYIQLWHGGIALKKIEGDCEAVLGAEYIRRARRDSAATDLFVSNSTFCTEMYRRAFWATCEIAEYGSPRNDRLMQQASEKQDVGADSRMAMKEDKSNPAGHEQPVGVHCGKEDAPEHRNKIAVYAPTYRSGHTDFADFDAGLLRAALAQRFGGEWDIYVRLHPLVAANRDFADMPGVIDISAERDLYEYLYRADVLITDYSNTMFEFVVTGKPVFLYAQDVQQYAGERGMYFDFDALPFPKAASCRELAGNIRTYRAADYEAGKRAFYESVGYKESGRAAALVADRIEEHVKKACNFPQ